MPLRPRRLEGGAACGSGEGRVGGAALIRALARGVPVISVSESRHGAANLERLLVGGGARVRRVSAAEGENAERWIEAIAGWLEAR